MLIIIAQFIGLSNKDNFIFKKRKSRDYLLNHFSIVRSLEYVDME